MLHVELRKDGVPDSAALAPSGSLVLTASATTPFCTELVVRNVVTGDTVTTPQQCHGQALAAQLGAQSLLPDSPALTDHCKGPAYRCAIDESLGQWDPERCDPWPAGEGTTGDATTGAVPTSTSDATTGASDSASAGPGADGLVDHGCACAGAPASPGPLALLLALACAPRRRRR
jgi:MYXO-CTERM domain-containing protein